MRNTSHTRAQAQCTYTGHYRSRTNDGLCGGRKREGFAHFARGARLYCIFIECNSIPLAQFSPLFPGVESQGLGPRHALFPPARRAPRRLLPRHVYRIMFCSAHPSRAAMAFDCESGGARIGTYSGEKSGLGGGGSQWYRYSSIKRFGGTMLDDFNCLW